MNQTITTEELLALTKSADLLRQTAEQALRCDSLARKLHNVRNDRDHLAGILEKIMQIFDGHPDLGPQDFAELPLEVLALHDMYNELLVKNKTLERENETLARNMPPEPPVEEPRKRPVIVQGMDYCFPQSECRVTKILGQQWCRTSTDTAEAPDTFGLRFRDGSHMVLCEVHQDVQTGALTYRPLSVEDLPLVQ